MGTEMMTPHYSAAWAWAGGCPFQWGKQVASHLGGTRDPMVVHWPERIKERGGLRSQFTHITDIGIIGHAWRRTGHLWHEWAGVGGPN